MPLHVSIVIPCYNVEEYIEECIHSVLEQTYPHIDIICVDDGSSDGTSEKIGKLQKMHRDKIRLISTANRGASAARNTGLQNARGDYIQFLDADDLLLPGKIEHQVGLVERSREKPAFIVGDCIRRYGNGRETRIRADDRSCWFGLLSIRLGNTCANLWRRIVLESVDGWNESLISSQEYDLMFRILQLDPVVIYDRELLTVLRHRESGSISRTDVPRNRLIAIELRQRIFDHLAGNDLLTGPLREHYYQLLFTEIRTLFRYESVKSEELLHKLFPIDFVPRDPSLYRKWYTLSYKLFGFPFTQHIWDRNVSLRRKAGKMLWNRN